MWRSPTDRRAFRCSATTERRESTGDRWITNRVYRFLGTYVKAISHWWQRKYCIWKTVSYPATSCYQTTVQRREPGWPVRRRSISLFNIDYKLIAKALGNRHKHVLPEITHDSQSRSILGRSISNNLLLVRDAIYIYIQLWQKSSTPSCGISLDQTKAFDRSSLSKHTIYLLMQTLIQRRDLKKKRRKKKQRNVPLQQI